MNLLRIFLLALVDHLSLFQTTESKFLDGSNFQQDLRSYEIVAPQMQTQGRWRRDISTQSSSGDHVGRAVFYLKGFGKEFLLDVSQNRVLLSANYISRSFDADGGEVIGKHEKNDNCFYQGTVQGFEHSSVAISTCQGLEGMIHDGNETYFIQPLPGNTDQHIMYRSRDVIQGDKRCGVDHSSYKPVMDELISLGKHRARRNVESETKYVELIIVNDRSQYVDLNSNRATVERRSKSIANVLDSVFLKVCWSTKAGLFHTKLGDSKSLERFPLVATKLAKAVLYRPIHIRIVLTMVEVWSQRDLIIVVDDSDKCLDNFMEYRNKELVKKHKHDNAMLLTHRSFKDSTVGKAAVMAMCGRRSGGVVQDHAISAAATAATMAHEMGHNFGMLHDEDIKGCKCDAPAENQGCIMSAVAKSKPSTEWSTCSVKSYITYLKRGMDSCLFNIPPSLFGDAVCGNGFKEEDEECDCGTIEECEKYSSGCCNATTCKLHPDAECDTGPCCGNCKLKPQGSLCRDKVNECDLPEFCTGKSELCPSNKYVRDGRPCANEQGYCYNGECPTHDDQCKDLWGRDAVSGPEGCYKMNEKGTVWGNCHQSGEVYLKCAPQDKLCGMLQCTNIDVDLPIIGTGRSSYHQYYDQTLCKSASLSLGLDVPDPGETVEGTKCGENKLCLDRKCTSIETLTSRLTNCPNNCSNGNGICNNEAECFCLSCWQGSDCSLWVDCKDGAEGNGTDLVTPTANITDVSGSEAPQTDKRSNLAGILIAVFLVIFLVIAAIFAFKYRARLVQKWRAFQQKAPGTKSYQGVSSGSPKQRRAANGAGAHINQSTDVEAAKPRPNISGPTLTSTTRNKPDVTVTTNPLGSTRFSNGPAKQDSQPNVAYKPTPHKPEKPAVEKEATTAKYPPAKLRNPEWPPRSNKEASLNRASSPLTANKPVNVVKPSRPQSHAGILNKPVVPPPPSGREPVKPGKPRRPESHAGMIDKPEPGKPVKPRRPESHAGMIDKPAPVKPRKPRRPESHAGILDKPAVPPPTKKPLSKWSASSQKEDSDGSEAPDSQPKVPWKPPLRPVDARFPTQPSEERPTSLPLKPSDLKKAGLAAGTKKPSSFSTADNKPKKVPLKPPGPIPPRPGAKPT